MEKIRKLILETTGETYEIERIRNLPLNDDFGRWVLTDGKRDQGILWVMRLSNQCARVLAFSVSNEFQGKGIGAEGWREFANAANGPTGSTTRQCRRHRDVSPSWAPSKGADCRLLSWP